VGDGEAEPGSNDPDSVAEPDRLDPRLEESGSDPVSDDPDGAAEPDRLGTGVPDALVAVDSGSVLAVSEENAEDRAVLLPESPLEPVEEGGFEPASRDAERVAEPDMLGPGVPEIPVAVDSGSVPAVSEENTEDGAVLPNSPLEESELEPAGDSPDTVAKSDGLGLGLPETPMNVDSGSVAAVSEEIAVAVAEPLEKSKLTLAGDDSEGVPEPEATEPGVPGTLVDVANESVVPVESPGTVAVPLPDGRVEVPRESLAVVPERGSEEVAVLPSEKPIDVDDGSVPAVPEIVPGAVAVLLPEIVMDVPGITEETPEAGAVPL